MLRFLFLAVLAAAIWSLPEWTNPCARPTTYRIGQVDERFRLSEAELRNALRRAEAVWEDEVELELFRHADDGEVVVNLVYDTRHQTAQENARQTGVIHDVAEEASNLRERQAHASVRYESARAEFLASQMDYQSRLDRHNLAVQAWNARQDPAAPGQYQALQRETAALEDAAAELERKRLAVNELAKRANSYTDRYNEAVEEVNANIEEYNTNAGREFKQGLFVEDRYGRRIDVYTYAGPRDLVHVLAHEFGHALGILHNPDPASIMYGVNSSEIVTLSTADLASLHSVCRLDPPKPTSP